MNVRDDEWSDQIEFDPRWEVQPEPGDEGGSGRGGRTLVALLVAVTVLVGAAWLLLGTPAAI